MPLSPVTVEQFAGLNLIEDPPEVGLAAAIDLLNVDFDRRGRIRSRDGFDNVTASAHTSRFRYLTPYYTVGGLQYVMACAATATATGAVVAYDTAGAAVQAYNPAGAQAFGRGVRFGTPSLENVYFCDVTGVGNGVRWDSSGGGWNSDANLLGRRLLTIQAGDNRLVAAGGTALGTSNISFSDAGTSTFSVGNDLEITPGDGEQITALESWGELVFAFKDSKFAVFYGNDVDQTGGSIFRYRMVNSGDGTPGVSTSGRPGVFFLNRRGIYLTTGDVPRLISRQIDPIFSGQGLESYSGSALNKAQITKASMCWLDERLYVAIPTGAATANDRLLVWDSLLDQWTVWDIPAAGLSTFRVSATDELVFSYATGSNHVGRVSSSFTTDDGTAISSFYTSGFFDGGSPEEKRVKRTRVHGSGSVGFSVATDYGATDTPATLTLATSPAVGQAADMIARRGRMLSFKLSSVSGGAWQARRLTMYLDDMRSAGMSSE